MLLCSTASWSQEETPEIIDVNLSGVHFQLDGHWSWDPFISSSVCDCEGVVADNDTMMLVVYTVAKGDTALSKRRYIWDGEYKGSGSTKSIEVGKWTFLEEKGQLLDLKYKGTLDAVHYVLRSDKKKYGCYQWIYFFGKAEDLDSQKETIRRILASFELQKLRVN